jgi:hypothetical protein
MYIIQKKTASRLVATSMAVALLASPVSSILSGGPEHVAAAAPVVDKSTLNLKPIWTKTLGEPSRLNTQATLIKNNLYYTVGKKYVAFDALAGKTRWTYPAAAVSQTVTDDKSVWFTDATGRLI